MIPHSHLTILRGNCEFPTVFAPSGRESGIRPRIEDLDLLEFSASVDDVEQVDIGRVANRYHCLQVGADRGWLSAADIRGGPRLTMVDGSLESGASDLG